MKILVCGINYAPDLIGIAKYTSEMCEWLAARGHEVKVVTAAPYYPDWEVPKPYSARKYTSEIIGNVAITRCPFYVPKTPTGLRRILHHMSFAVSSGVVALATAVRFQPDIVLTIAPSIMSAPSAWLAARCSGAKAWLHVQDFEIDAAFGLDFVTGNELQRIALWFESVLLRRFDRVSSISTKMVSRLHAKGVSSDSLVEFRNWAGDTRKPANDSERSVFDFPGSKTVLLYSGNMGTKQGLEFIVKAARELEASRNDILFVFCGSGPMRNRLIDESKDLRNVQFLDLQAPDRISALLRCADIHLLPQRAEAADCVLPSKLGGMFASGRPVIAMASPDSQLADEVEGAGLVVPPGDVPALVSAILTLTDNTKRRTELGVGAQATASRRWDKQTILDDFEKELLLLESKDGLRSHHCSGAVAPQKIKIVR
jgi:colanic acid biosynthesis glycosyl transferase WcaI